jgi:hypothetical protein
MRATAVVLAALIPLALAGCNKADKGPKTLEQAKAEAKQLERPDPGKYKQVTKITKFDAPGAPPQVAEQMKKMMEGQGHETTYCLTKADSEKGFEEMFKKVAEGECKYDRFDATSGSIDAIMTCQAKDQGTMRLAMNGTVSPRGSHVKVDVQQTGAKNMPGNATIAMDVASERLGDCT